jgi:pimeloyl-[acyl-carrier protein] methyl ester esterase
VNGLHVALHGAGAPLVLVHGWGMHGGVFAPLVERLAASHALYVVDLPGHGSSRDSTVPMTLAAVVDALTEVVPPAAWLGWSLGGLFALHATARRPARVHALAMLSATPRFVAGTDWPHGVDAAVFRGFAQDLAQDYRGTLQRFIALETIGAAQARDTLRQLQAALFARGEPTPTALHAGLDLLAGSDLREALPGLAVPSLWLGGRRDRLVAPAALEAAAALAPGARVELLAHAAHAPFLTDPDAVAGTLATWLATSTPGSRAA